MAGTFDFVMRLAATIAPTLVGGVQRRTSEVNHDPQIRNADKMWHQTSANPSIGAIAAGSGLDLDLTSLALKDSAGATVETVSFADVRGFVIRNTSEAGSGAVLSVGGGTGGAGAADAWAGAAYPLPADATVIQIQPQSAMAFHCDKDNTWAVVASTEHVLGLYASGASVSYEIEIIGE